MDPGASVREAKPRTPSTGTIGLALPAHKRLLMLIINAWPILHCAATALILALPWAAASTRLLAALISLYATPPLLARILILRRRPREGVIPAGSRTFFLWWALFNLQVLFCRFGFLEECLRLVPGLYSMWLRLWGANIGRLTYWAAGVQILDRTFIHIGDDVVFGAGVRINPHVLVQNDKGSLDLILATVTVGDRAMVGGYSLLAAGTEIASDECTRAMLLSPPFSHWSRGSRRSSPPPAS